MFAGTKITQHTDSKKFIEWKLHIGMVHGFKAVSENGTALGVVFVTDFLVF